MIAGDHTSTRKKKRTGTPGQGKKPDESSETNWGNKLDLEQGGPGSKTQDERCPTLDRGARESTDAGNRNDQEGNTTPPVRAGSATTEGEASQQRSREKPDLAREGGRRREEKGEREEEEPGGKGREGRRRPPPKHKP